MRDASESLAAPYSPLAISDGERAFPANVRHLMPAEDDIPQEFWRGHNDWTEFQERWFFSGLKDLEVDLKDGIDRKVALRHLSAIQGSFEPKHEYKRAAVAYLASLWFDAVRYTVNKS